MTEAITIALLILPLVVVVLFVKLSDMHNEAIEMQRLAKKDKANEH